MYEVGRQLLERGHADKARRYFRGLQERPHLSPPISAWGSVDSRRQDQGRRRDSEGGVRQDPQHHHPSPAGRAVWPRTHLSPSCTHNGQFYLGKLYYRLEMVDEAFDILSTVEGPQDQLVDYHKIMANLFLRKQHMNRPSSNSGSASVQKARRRAVRLYRLPAGHHGMVRTVPSVRELEHVCRPPLAGRRVPSIAGRHLDRRTQHSLSGHCFSIRNRVAFAPR